jgi:hypothetical protein
MKFDDKEDNEVGEEVNELLHPIGKILRVDLSSGQWVSEDIDLNVI